MAVEHCVCSLLRGSVAGLVPLAAAEQSAVRIGGLAGFRALLLLAEATQVDNVGHLLPAACATSCGKSRARPLRHSCRRPSRQARPVWAPAPACCAVRISWSAATAPWPAASPTCVAARFR